MGEFEWLNAISSEQSSYGRDGRWARLETHQPTNTDVGAEGPRHRHLGQSSLGMGGLEREMYVLEM